MERRICRTSSPIISDVFEREHRSERKYNLLSSIIIIIIIIVFFCFLIKFNFDNKIKRLKDSTLSFPHLFYTIRLWALKSTKLSLSCPLELFYQDSVPFIDALLRDPTRYDRKYRTYKMEPEILEQGTEVVYCHWNSLKVHLCCPYLETLVVHCPQVLRNENIVEPYTLLAANLSYFWPLLIVIVRSS